MAKRRLNYVADLGYWDCDNCLWSFEPPAGASRSAAEEDARREFDAHRCSNHPPTGDAHAED